MIKLFSLNHCATRNVVAALVLNNRITFENVKPIVNRFKWIHLVACLENKAILLLLNKRPHELSDQIVKERCFIDNQHCVSFVSSEAHILLCAVSKSTVILCFCELIFNQLTHSNEPWNLLRKSCKNISFSVTYLEPNSVHLTAFPLSPWARTANYRHFPNHVNSQFKKTSLFCKKTPFLYHSR